MPTTEQRDSEANSFSSSSTQHVSIAEFPDNTLKHTHRRRRTIEVDSGDDESDKDLVIITLKESLQIHKEIMEELQREKDTFVTNLKREREEEKRATEKEKEEALAAMEEQIDKYRRLEEAYRTVVTELEAKKNEYRKMESNFYDHVRRQVIRPTDDDLSTIQYEFTYISNQLNNLCMGLKSKMDRTGGTTYILTRWEDREADIRRYLLKPPPGGSAGDAERLEPGIITMFTEKLLMEILRTNIFDQPIHAGVSINDTFKQVSEWIGERNHDWAKRLQQQVSALVVRQPGDDEQANMARSLNDIVDHILDQLICIYPRVRETPNQQKKIETLVARAAKLNLAMKGQEFSVYCESIEEGITCFNESTMKPVSRSDPAGRVLFVISPPFIAVDPKDGDHGFVIPGKVYCVSDEHGP
ncbi:hypothetical protein BX666DRAFT_1846776 [Dichotomocladium elegans]|nr:hypothetical protein BX666DRAFT_1846776 [Dichotomocladium elegans]